MPAIDGSGCSGHRFEQVAQKVGERGAEKHPLPPKHHAARRDFRRAADLLACAKCSSSSPLRTAAIKVSITDGSLSSDGTAMALLPFSNSSGFRPSRMKKATEPFGAI